MVETTTPTEEKKEIKCSACTKSALIKKRIPTGWKRTTDYFCPNCWGDRYILRAVILPVASPVNISWEDLRAALKTMWTEMTRISNFLIRQLTISDVIRDPEMTKLPTMAPTYFYPELRRLFPVLPSRTIASLEQAVTAKYRAKRREVIWLSSASLPNFRYPQPFTVPNQGWSVKFEDDFPFVDFSIGEHKLSLRLRGGSRYRRQLGMVRSIASGDSVQGELAIYPKDKDIIVKMVAWIPRKESVSKQQSGTLRARSAKDALIIAVDEKDERIWTYHADMVPRWAAEHRKRLQAWSDDSKAEQRPVPAFAQRRNEASVKYHRRVNTAADQAARYLVNYARRRRFASISFDDSDRSFCADFVWFKFVSRMQTLCDEYGMEFALATGQHNPAEERTMTAG
jgi:hypothetical protein